MALRRRVSNTCRRREMDQAMSLPLFDGLMTGFMYIHRFGDSKNVLSLTCYLFLSAPGKSSLRKFIWGA